MLTIFGGLQSGINMYVYIYIFDRFITLPLPMCLAKGFTLLSRFVFVLVFAFCFVLFFGACTVYFYCRFCWRVAAISMARCLTRGKCEHLSLGQRADSWQQAATPLAVVGAGGLSTLSLERRK